MSEQVTVWIVEDQKIDAVDAWKVVEDVRDELGATAAIYWADNFDWLPHLRAAPDAEQAAITSAEYPDIVVLDLCQSTSNGEKLRAKGFYSELRKWESHKPGGLPALIIFWSVFRGRKDTDEFVKSTAGSDVRVVPIDTKRAELLQTTLQGLWRRVLEERENG